RSRARDAKASARCRARWNFERIRFGAVGICGIIYAHLEKCAAEKFVDAQLDILRDVAPDFSRTRGLFGSGEVAVVGAPPRRLAENLMCRVDFPRAAGGLGRTG